jgi:predicted nuclease of predicted toxin-antitoxin system
LKLLIDECLSPQLARRLAAGGRDAVHVQDRKRLGAPDHEILRVCVDEDRTLVTQNAEDFRGLVGRTELHPGLVILAENSLERS